MKIESFTLNDDGQIPNSSLPLLVYTDVFEQRGSEAAEWLENRFRENSWTNCWRNGVFSYHHYHSSTHEVLGVYSGDATLQMGGDSGVKLNVKAGTVIIIPAGVAHKNLGASQDFRVVGSIPDGSNYDMKTGKKSERPEADHNITSVSVPTNDPVLGQDKGVPIHWDSDGYRAE